MSRHTCHAAGCDEPVPPKLFMCRAHWNQLDARTQQAIWREYRPGQERDKRPSVRYLAVTQYAIAKVAFRPHDAAAANASAYHMMFALTFRQRAIDQGLGDPLKGFVPEDAEAADGV